MDWGRVVMHCQHLFMYFLVVTPVILCPKEQMWGWAAGAFWYVSYAYMETKYCLLKERVDHWEFTNHRFLPRPPFEKTS